MSNTAKYYIESLRLRTLPLSMSGVILGGLLSIAAGYCKIGVFVWALLTALSLQILSNLSNELGDLQKGTDNENRLGPIRTVQSGKLTKKNMIGMMLIFIGLSVYFGLALIWVAFDDLLSTPALIMLTCGAFAIAASIKYTFGGHAYGYVGLGDLFVFLFFGLVNICGVYYLSTSQLPLKIFLPAASIGLMSTAVLNVNNMRDIENDADFEKKTMVVRMGLKRAKIYHFLLITFSFLLMTIFSFMQNGNVGKFLYLLSLPLFVYHLNYVMQNEGRSLDKQMKVQSLGTLLFACLSGIGMILSV